ncbi:ATP-dependent DNA helicase PIF1-like protein [Tanacetum coccineum]|uniref:ATP-dependent DNA helicase n=1 Tax=Tanacetum coccineum TaxID=301880 RepID=A0ABQ5GRA7_9ASTR
MQHLKRRCFAYGLLNDDKEWSHAIAKAKFWVMGPQLWDLFITILVFCDVSRLLQLWEENWTALSKDILHKKGYFPDLLRPNPRLLTNLDNRLIREALDFDVNKSRAKHAQLHSLLNPKQRMVYDKVIESMYSKSGQFYFIYKPGGTGKSFVYRTIIARLRSSQNIVLAVASSSTNCIITPAWLPDSPHQICHPVRAGGEQHVRMRVNEYTDNGDIDTRKQDFNKWVLAVGDGRLPAEKKFTEDEPTWIEILEDFLIRTWINPIEQIVLKTYPDFITRQSDESYLKERAILTPRNDDADAINEFMFKKLGGTSMTYHSADEICKASTDTEDQHHLYPVEFLNILNFLGMPPHALCLKRELLVMLTRNLNLALGQWY